MSQNFFRLFFVLVLIIGSVALPAPQPVHAAGPWYVTTTGDDNNNCLSPGTACATINGAIGKAAPGDTINIADGVYTGTGTEVVLIDRDITLSGGWNGDFTIQGGISIIDGQSTKRGLTVVFGTAFVEHFLIQNGSYTATPFSGAGVANNGILTINNSAVARNHATDGGGIYNSGTLTINNSSVTENTATYGGGINNGGGLVTLNNSTVSGNTGSWGGGGIYNQSSGILNVNSSTVSNNKADGGIFGSGGGIYNWSGSVTLQNSIIASNSATNIYPDCNGFISLGYNIIQDASGCAFSPSTGDLTFTSALLGPLVGNPAYHPLSSASPAVNAGNPTGCTDQDGNVLATDQRGVAYVGTCDIGAYEYTTPGAVASIVAVGGTPQSTNPLTTFGMPLQAMVLDSIGSPNPGISVTFTAPGSGASGTFTDSGTVTTNAITNEFGAATSANFTANTIAGSYIVMATASGLPVPANFQLSNALWLVAPGGNDTNDCLSPSTPCATINGAIGKAGTGQTIKVATGTYTGIGSEVVYINKDITLSGGWDATFTTQNGKSTIDGENVRQGIYIVNFVNNINVLLEYLIVQNGTSGISNNGQTLTLNNSIVSNNWGSGVWSGGILTINNSVISNNTDGDGGGGIEINGGTATISNTVVKDNISSSYGGGIFNNGNALTMNNSAVTGNIANNGGGTNGGGGILNCYGCTLNINNSTISGNTALNAGGGGILNVGTLLSNNATISNNRANMGGGINMNSGSATLQNTILGGNIADSAPDCSGTVGSSGYNIIGNTSDCIFSPDTGDQINVNPQLGTYPIGSPPYHALLTGSPAIDAGNPVTCLATDQRGIARVSTCDIGSYEYTVPGPAVSLSAVSSTSQRTGISSAFSKPLQAAALDNQGSPVSGVTIDFTAPASGPSGTFADSDTNTTSAVTDESGVATTPTFTANNQPGAYTVSASATGLGSVNFSLEQFVIPPNDNFPNAEVITSLPFSATVDITNAGVEPNENQFSCTNVHRSVWYSFIPTESMTVRINMQGSLVSTALGAIYHADGPGITGLSVRGCAYYSNPPVNVHLDAGEIYYIQVSSYSAEVGIIQFNLEQIPSPANDNFINTEPIGSLPFSTTVDITGAGIEPGEPQSCNNMDKTVWYRFAPTENMSIRVDTQGTNISNNVTIYRSTGPGSSDLEFLKCTSNSGDVFLAEAGQIYYLQAGTFSGWFGEIQINLKQIFPPANDAFSKAEAITSPSFSTTVDITDAWNEPNEPQNCYYMYKTVWYAFTPTETMTVRANTQGSSIGANLNVYQPYGSGISEQNFLGCTVNTGSTAFFAEAGQTYYLQAGNAFGEDGTIQINLEQVFPPANDRFTNSESITSLPFTTTVDITDALTEFGEPQYCYTMNNTVWYSFTPTETVAIQANAQGSAINTNLNIYQAAGSGISNLQFLQCAVPGDSYTFLAEVGHTYYIQAGPAFGEVGTIQVNLEQIFPPVNDRFTGAAGITSLPFSAATDITNATTELGEPQYCYTMDHTVWYSFTPTENIKLRADTQGSAINGNVNIYHAAGLGIADLQFLNCSGPSGSPVFTAIAGQTYYFQVGAAYGETGNVQFNLAEVPVITGRITDAVTGAPLPGNVQPYAFVTLQRICGDGCLEYVNSQNADGEGRFLFDSYYYGTALPAGTYQIEASASLYQTKQFGPFEFTGSSLDLGDIPLNPPSVIRGRAVDADTGDPLPNASVTLRRCDSGGCNEFINSQLTDGLGQFQFNSFYYGSPLPGGTYELEISAASHETKRIEVVVTDGEYRDLGDILLSPPPLIGSIRGRLIDNTTGKPVSQTFSPSLQLYRCVDGNCFEFVNSQVPDGQGRFRFETDYAGNRLIAGTYQIRFFADQYQEGQTQPFTVGEAENKNVGNLRIVSYPVRFSDIQPCAQIPGSGGECIFSVRITNGMDSELEGAAWSLVDSDLHDSFTGYTNFQVKEPQGFYLDSGKSRVFRFRFNVPANAGPYGSYICTRVFVGQGFYSFFNTVGFRDLFCVYRGADGFVIASPPVVSAPAQQSITAAATGVDIEPNNSCQTAQDIGNVPLPFVLDGLLDSSQGPDVDFFRFTGTPGTVAIIDHEGASTGKGTLDDPLLGFFDSNCNLLTFNDDSNSLNSHLDVTVPADGIFILAATSYPDFSFIGGGNGTYQLTVAPVQVIGSISGRATDAVTGKTLRGDAAPYAYVRLLRCEVFGCFDVNSQNAGRDGRFRFETDSNGAPLRTGNYIVVVSADQYQTSQTEMFSVGEGENYDAGKIGVNSFPVRFSDIKPCVVPSGGGFCDFSVRITNGLAVPLSGKAWSIVSGSGIGSFTNFTVFQSALPIDGKLDPGKTGTLFFRFYVRGSVPDGAYICATAYIGQGTNAFFNTVGQRSLFCFSKGSSGFTLMSEQQTQSIMQQMEIQQIEPPELKVE